MIADPMTGPADAPMPPNDDVMPNAVARLDGGTSRNANAVVAVMSTDDASPISPRPTTSQATLRARAQHSEPARNPITPTEYARLRPVRSAITPPSTSVAPATTV